MLCYIYNHDSIFYPFTVSVNKCDGSCNTIDDPYLQNFIPSKSNNMNAKVFN